MKIGIEWPETFIVESQDLQVPWRVITFAAERLGRRVWPCIEYVQGKFEQKGTLVFRVVVAQPAQCKFSFRHEAVFSYSPKCSSLVAQEIRLHFSEEDVVKAGEGLVEVIAQVIDEISRHVKDRSYLLEAVAEQARRADAISED